MVSGWVSDRAYQVGVGFVPSESPFLSTGLRLMRADLGSESTGAHDLSSHEHGRAMHPGNARRDAGCVMTNQPTAVHLTVVDGCGEWKTFVGGGTAAGF